MISMMTGVAGRFGLNPREAERFIKFLVVGSIGFIVDFGVFNLLLHPFDLLLVEGTTLHQAIASLGLTAEQTMHLAPTFAGIVSFIAAIISNFTWNRYWTYPDSRSKSMRRQLAMFTVVSVAGILLRIPLIAFTHRPFVHMVQKVAPLTNYAERIGENMALALSVLVVMFWNFFVNRYWTYNDVE
jgi:putative flippase GtrA